MDSNPAALRAYLTENHSTFREPIKSSLLTCWNSITSTNLKLKFIPIFTIPFLALACSTTTSSSSTPVAALAAESSLSSLGNNLLTDILCCDYSQTQQFKLTSPHIYDCVCISVLQRTSTAHHAATNSIISSRYIPSIETITEFLRNGLMKLFQQNEILNTTHARNFAHDMRTLLILLFNLSEYPSQTLEYEEERSFAYHKLMTFFEEINRQDSYVKTLHNHAREMIQLENFIEGGKLIYLHIRLLDWSEKMLEVIDLGGDDHHHISSSSPYSSSSSSSSSGGVRVTGGAGSRGTRGGDATGGGPVVAEAGAGAGISNGLGILNAEKSYQRKITLIKYVVEIFEQGKAYEECIELLNELCYFYREIQPNYVKLTEVMSQQIDYYLKITTTDRYYPTMFRVGYYGAGITNELIRNKEFIYKGAPLESIIDFSHRIKKKYPTCEIISPKIRPNEEHFHSSDKGYLQISKVTHHQHGTRVTQQPPHTHPLHTQQPLHNQQQQLFYKYDPPSYVKKYLENQNLQYFYYQKPFRKREIKSSNEFLDLWVETIILKSEFPFPNISRRSLVVSSESIILNPIEMAVQGLLERNQELRRRNIEMSEIEDGQAGQSYTMTLSGTVDAAVNGGLSNYETFINGSYKDVNPEIEDDVKSTPEKQLVIQQLISALHEQLQLLEEGMKLHQRKCLAEMRQLHNHLYLTYQKMKTNLNRLLEQHQYEQQGH